MATVALTFAPQEPSVVVKVPSKKFIVANDKTFKGFNIAMHHQHTSYVYENKNLADGPVYDPSKLEKSQKTRPLENWVKQNLKG